MFEWYPFSDKAWDTILNSNAPINIWEGAVRSGKTISSMVRWIEIVKSTPRSMNLIMVGKTERTLKRNIIDVIIDMVGEKNAKLNLGTGEFWLYGRPIYLAGANDERSQEKIRGLTICHAYGDEITLWPESFFTMLLTRLSMPGSKFFGTTNPDAPTHWLKKEYIDKKEEKNINVYHFTLEDNNYLMDNNPGYIAQMKASFSGVWYKRLIEGLWCVADGAIFPQFDEFKHVVDVGDRRFRYYTVGIDYGTTNPTAFILMGFDSPFKEKYIIKEFYWDSKLQRRQKTDAEYVDDLVRFMNGYRVGAIYVDPSAASFITQLRKSGIVPREACNDVLDGIRFVSTELTKGNLFIDRSCENLLRELPSYTWDEEKSIKRGEDVPLKENDHACLTGDTLIDTVNGQIPIKDLVGTSGLLYSLNGAEQTIEQYSSVVCTDENAEIFEIEFEDGRTVRCTSNHPVLTKRGWVIVADLTNEDEIIEIEIPYAKTC